MGYSGIRKRWLCPLLSWVRIEGKRKFVSNLEKKWLLSDAGRNFPVQATSMNGISTLVGQLTALPEHSLAT